MRGLDPIITPWERNTYNECMAQISIIIPVYNSESYLKDCIESILNQSYEDFEAIFIDDGSQDASFSIISEFAHRDNRIKLYHQENSGVSAARNLGLKYASGEYITFIDSDDTISFDYLYQLYHCITCYSPDIVFSGIINVINGCETSRVALEEVSLSLNTERNLVQFFKTPLLTSPVSKLYKRQIIQDNNLQFDITISYAEDKDFNLQYFQHIQKAYALSYCGYFYREVENSLSHKKYEYQYRIENRHWGVKKRMVESLSDYSSKGKSYLVNELFYIIYDELSDITYSLQSIKDMMNRWKRSVQYVDLEYLTGNFSLLEQPFWMKFFLKLRLFWIIFVVLSIKKDINGKTAR